jgi:hypothetical protein
MATWLTGAAGLLILGVAVVMMVVAAPARTHPLAHHTAAQPPGLVVTQAEGYPPFMITESWLAAPAAPRPNGARR